MSESDCLFCKIVAGKIPCAKVYEDHDVLAFLDIAPVSPGHTLLIPKAHHVDILDLPTNLAPALLSAIQKVGRGLLDALDAKGLNLGMNNGHAAGQVIFHAHWHLIPRHLEDGLTAWPQSGYSSSDAMHELARTIAGHIHQSS